jgi:hypothetical protein
MISFTNDEPIEENWIVEAGHWLKANPVEPFKCKYDNCGKLGWKLIKNGVSRYHCSEHLEKE